MQRSLRRSLELAAMVALTAATSSAQFWNTSGDVMAHTSNGSYHLINSLTQVGTVINWGSFAPPDFDAFEIDQERPGGFIYSASADLTVGIQIFRTQLAGANAIGQSLVMTIPNTNGLTPRQLYREFTGSYLLLSQTSPTGTHVMHRLGLSTSSGIARAIPAIAGIDNLVNGFQTLTDIASDTQGRIYVTGPGNVGLGFVGRVWRIETDENTFSSPWESIYINPSAVAVNHFNNDMIAVGGQNTTLTSGPYNFYCGPDVHASTSLAGLQFIGNCPFGVAGVQYLSLDVTATAIDWITAENCGFNSSQRFTATNCSAAVASPVWVSNAGAIVKILRADPIRYQPRYGYGCPSAAGMAFNLQVLAPRINQPWVMAIVAAPPNTPVTFSLGFSDASASGLPLPFPLDPAADCVVFASPDATASLGTDGMGGATFQLQVPNMPSLIGTAMFSQWYGVNGSALWSTSGVTSTIM